MKQNILIICDSDEHYLKRLDGFLRDSLRIPFDIIGFTDKEALLDFEEKEDSLLVIAGSLFKSSTVKGFKNILVLDERNAALREDHIEYGMDEDVNLKHTGKYQSSEKIAESILSMCLEMPKLSSSGIRRSYKNKMKITAFFTPERRTDQTGKAIEYASEEGAKEKVLYFCNDPYCTNKIIRGGEYDENLSDLMYYAQCEDDRFGIYLEKIVRKNGNFEYIPLPMGQVRDCEGADYIRLLRKIEETGSYEMLIADFSEPFKNLFEVLKMCDRIYTLKDVSGGSSERIELFRNELERVEDFDMSKLVICSSKDVKGIIPGSTGGHSDTYYTRRDD